MKRTMAFLAAIILFCTTSAFADLGPVLDFHFDNDSGLGESYTNGGTVYDYSGNGNTGYLSDPPGVPTWTSEGVFGGAFDFTGNGGTSGQSILVNHDDSLNPGSGDFALVLWIIAKDNKDGDILRKGSTANSSTWYKLEHSDQADNNLFYFEINTDGKDARIHSSQAYNDGEWHFIVAQRNGSLGELWIDGALDKTAEVSGNVWNTGNLGIGSKDTLDDDFLNGTLDSLSIYMRALSEQEIQQMYSAVPEPATFCLLGLGAIGLLRKRSS